MTKNIKGHEIESAFTRDGVSYTTMAANVDPSGRIVGYQYEAHIRPPDFVQVVLDSTLTGAIIGFSLAGLITLWGVFIL